MAKGRAEVCGGGEERKRRKRKGRRKEREKEEREKEKQSRTGRSTYEPTEETQIVYPFMYGEMTSLTKQLTFL